MLQLINDLSFETVSNLTTLYDQETVATYRIYSINRPGRLFEAGRLLNFQNFQQV